MHLIIDQGNSFTKIGLFDQAELKEVWRVSDHELHPFLDSKIEDQTISALFCSSVRKDPSTFTRSFSSPLPLIPFDPSLGLPFKINYSTPHTLGLDRIANVSGALSLGYSEALIVDCGSCTTYTLLSANSLEGGAISPGLRMRFRAMHEFTGMLPSLDYFPDTIALLGKSTEESMLSGVIGGLITEIDGMIEKYCSEIPSLSVILTGGDASYLGSHLKSSIFANSNLTLLGLNQIYLYQKA